MCDLETAVIRQGPVSHRLAHMVCAIHRNYPPTSSPTRSLTHLRTPTYLPPTSLPQDLSPLAREEEEPWVPQRRRMVREATPGAQEVRSDLHYKNIDMLLKFVSASGRIKPRRQTRLPPRLQSRVARAVKMARQMALIPYEMRVGDGGEGDTWRRMREYRAGMQ